MKESVIKLFWPKECHFRGGGLVVGWHVRDYMFCVASILHDVDLEELIEVLNRLAAIDSSSLSFMSSICKGLPKLIGIVGELSEHSARLISEKGHSKCLVISTGKSTPVVNSIFIDGTLKQMDCELFLFDKPNPISLKYLSIEPLSLDIHTSLVQPETKQKTLLRKLDEHMKSSPFPKTSTNDMEYILNQINSSFEVSNILNYHLNLDYEGRIPFSAKPSPPNPKESYRISSFILQPIMILLFIFRVFAEIILKFLNFKIKDVSLVTISATAQQTNIRLQQICHWPWQYMLLMKRDWRNTLATRVQYIKFYNNVWLVANDLILGVAFGLFLLDNVSILSNTCNTLIKDYAIHTFESSVVWLMGWPAGLKLNSFLDKFIGEMFLWLIGIWTVFVGNFVKMMPLIVGIVGLSGIFGASMIIALIGDLLSFFTFHIFIFYIVAARIFNWQHRILLSLLHLFGGKKYNVLRKRLDSSDYDLDQLLLGTILFTLLSFLIPTVLVYYVLFAGSRIFVVFLQVGLELVLSGLNHFPLFAIMLRFKDPGRLPGGIQFSLKSESHQPVFEIKNIPISGSAVFSPFINLCHRYFTHHISKAYLMSVLKGDTISPISHLMMLPKLDDSRPTLFDFWLFLKYNFTSE